MQGRPALLELAFGRAWVEAKDPKQTGKPISKLVKERKAWRGWTVSGGGFTLESAGCKGFHRS